MTVPALAPVPPAALVLLASIGWEIESVDLDLPRGRATMVIRRADGRWLHLDADGLGRATVERWHRDREWMRSSPRAASYEWFRDTFLGRDRCEWPRQALRVLAHYVAANPAPGRAELSTGTVKAALALLMGSEPR